MAVNGNNLQIYLGTDATRVGTTTGAAGERTPIAEAQSTTFSVAVADIDVTTKSSNSFKESIPGEISATLSFEGLLPATLAAATDGTERQVVNLAQLAINRTTIYWEFGLTGNARFTGEGYFNANDFTGGTNDSSTYTGSITVTGTFQYDSDVTS